MIESHNLPWYCQYYPKGCRYILEEDDLEPHQNECAFRPVNCPHLDCEKHGEIAFKDIMNHVQDPNEHTELPPLTEAELNAKIGGFTVKLNVLLAVL